MLMSQLRRRISGSKNWSARALTKLSRICAGQEFLHRLPQLDAAARSASTSETAVTQAPVFVALEIARVFPSLDSDWQWE
eukprot:2960560-Pyramimonas_sp.AAC.1